TLDSIKVRVLEGVRLNFREVNAPWDGSYRKAGSPENYAQNQTIPTAYIDAFYDSSIGKIHFMPNGAYEINNGGTLRQGKYAFFGVNGQELLELRGEGPSGPIRESYLVEADNLKSVENPESLRQTLTLLRVRIGAKGIERLYEGTISLTLAQ
ncbi:MAG: hypothetical protein LBH43_16185, partial [Treponema sp.]|nr:hypothetical protein [Treponema sp.]